MAKYGRGSISLQSSNLSIYNGMSVKRGFEFVMRKDLPLLLFDIVAIASKGKPLPKQSSSHFPVLQQFCFGDGGAFLLP